MTELQNYRMTELQKDRQGKSSIAPTFSLVLKILSGNEILTSIKGCNSVANLQKMTIYNTNVDLVNDNVYTKFG